MTSVVPAEAPRTGSPVVRVLHRFEDALAAVALGVMVVLPLAEILLRRFAGTGIPGSIPFVQHLVLWVGFLGAALAAREGTMLALATGTFLPAGRARDWADTFAATVAAAVSTMLCVGAFELMMSEREAGTVIAAGVTTWVAQTVLPFAFGLIALRTVWRTKGGWASRAIAACGMVAGGWLVWHTTATLPAGFQWPLVAALLVAAGCGTPIFVVLGGLAIVLFLTDGVGPSAILIETYQLAVKPTLASIPLFTLCGFLLAEGKAPERLLNVFRALFGWFPGGTAVVCAMLSAFFTIFTGGSGVTILALGGLLLPALIKDGYRERFSVGLLTASGSLGLLLPPSLPLILYAIVAQIPVEDLFIGGILPGVLLLGLTAAWGVREGATHSTGRTPFSPAGALRALWQGKWEVALPVVVLVALFGGFATIVEAAALAALYAFIVQVFVHRDVRQFDTLRRVFAECVATVGGVLVILGVAVGLTSYLIGADCTWPVARMDAGLHQLAEGFSADAEPLPARRRLPDGHLLRHLRRRAAHRSTRAAFRHPPGAPRHHLRGEPRAGVPHATGRHEPVSCVLSIQEAAARSDRRRVADAGRPWPWRRAHHLHSVDDYGPARGAGQDVDRVTSLAHY